MNFQINIPNGANELIHILQNNGYKAYVVGGCVRDSILGREPHDWDICTSATPTEMLEIFKDKRVIETGLKHGTITVLNYGQPYEITTFRIDGVYLDNRRPNNVTFTSDIIEDLKRRDFTINAMAYNDEEGLIDPFDGMIDIENKIIRCVGSARERFEEDALRILRAIRFACQLNFVVDATTCIEIHHQCDRLKNISFERIQSEFCKIVSTDAFAMRLSLYKDVFSIFIPELQDIIGFNQNNPYHQYDVFGHTFSAIENCDSSDLITRLAVFFHDFGKPHCYQDGEDGHRHFKGHGAVSSEIAYAIMGRLRFDNDTRYKVAQLVHFHDATFEVGHKYIKRWLNKIGEEQFRRLLNMRRADIKGQSMNYDKARIDKVNAIEKLLEEVLNECFSLKSLAVNGNDLIGIGYKPGVILGQTLSILLQKVIDGEIENKKEVLLEEAKRCIL